MLKNPCKTYSPENLIAGFLLLFVLPVTIQAQSPARKIIIVAGQSNALNWHADAAALASSSADSSIPYYYHTGLSPSRLGTPINSTSGNKWTTLSYQTQDPYIRYEENFFGPEMTLARALFLEIDHLAVIKLAYAGTSLSRDWRKGESAGDQLYELMMAQIDTATGIINDEGIDHEYAGFFWIQGESDADNEDYASNYVSNLESFIENLRTDLHAPQLKFVVSRIGNASPYPFKSVVRDAQLEVASADSYTAWVDTDDLPLDTDNIHLVAAGELELGKRMAEAWRGLPDMSVHNEKAEVLGSVRLMQNYPNPFNPSTSISFELEETAPVQLEVFNMLGRKVATLVDSKLNSGSHSVTFNAKNLASGIYNYQLITPDYHLTKKMILVK